MKSLVLTGNTAIEFWRGHDLSETGLYPHARFESMSPSRSEMHLADALTRIGADPDSICLLVDDENLRHRRSGRSFVICSHPLPIGFLRIVDKGLLVSSPEMCFMQIAASQGVIEAIRYGTEICGTYANATRSAKTRYGRKKLSDSETLNSLIAAGTGLHGVKRARTAARYVTEGSASPLETATELLLCLPQRLGGFGLPVPEFNVSFGLDELETVISGKREFRCDLYWRDYDLALEYQSDAFHSNVRSLHEDAHRNNVLTSRGLTIIQFTWETLRDPARLEYTARMMQSHMGLRIRTRLDGDRIASARSRLRRIVLG